MKLDSFKSSPCSLASLIFPLPFILGLVFGFVVLLAVYLKLLGSDAFYVTFMVGSMAFAFWFVIVLICSLVGVMLALAGLFRKEKRPLLAVLGVIVNGCPLILGILVLFQNRL
jgi:hypothetical protein